MRQIWVDQGSLTGSNLRNLPRTQGSVVREPVGDVIQAARLFQFITSYIPAVCQAEWGLGHG